MALVKVLKESPTLTPSLPTCVDFVSQTKPYNADSAFEAYSNLMDVYKTSDTNDVAAEQKEDEEIDRIVADAMESVSGFSITSQLDGDNDDGNFESQKFPQEVQLSNREKSVRLLSRCSSWTRLEHTLDKMERQGQ